MPHRPSSQDVISTAPQKTTITDEDLEHDVRTQVTEALECERYLNRSYRQDDPVDTDGSLRRCSGDRPFPELTGITVDANADPNSVRALILRVRQDIFTFLLVRHIGVGGQWAAPYIYEGVIVAAPHIYDGGRVAVSGCYNGCRTHGFWTFQRLRVGITEVYRNLRRRSPRYNHSSQGTVENVHSETEAEDGSESLRDAENGTGSIHFDMNDEAGYEARADLTALPDNALETIVEPLDSMHLASDSSIAETYAKITLPIWPRDVDDSFRELHRAMTETIW